MATVASLQIKIGADVSAAINGLTKAQFAADQVKEAYIEANAATVAGGFVIAGWAQNFSTAINQVQSQLEKIDTTNLDKESKENVSSLQNMVQGAEDVADRVGTMAAAFSGAQAIAGPALAGIASLFPALGASIAALAGPIGLAVGLAAALAAGYIANESAIRQNISANQELNNSINTEIAQAGTMISVLKNGNLTYDKRNELIGEINDKYGTTIKNLKDETQFINQVDTAYKAVAESIKNKILLAGAQDELAGLIKQQIETEKLRDGLKNVAAELPNINKGLADLGASPSQSFNADSFLGGKQGIVDINEKIKTQDDEIIAKSKQVGDIFNKILAGKQGGSGGQSDADKIKEILAQLSNEIDTIGIKFSNGLIPDDVVPKVEAIRSAIDKIGDINPDSSAIATLIAQLKNVANQNPVEIPVTLGEINTTSLASLDALPDRVSDVAKKMQASFVNTNPFLFLETKAIEVQKVVDTEFKKLANTISTVANQVQSALSVIATLDSNSIAERNQEVDAYYEKQKALIESQVNDEGLKNKKLESLEKDVAAKRKAIKRDEAAANKRNSIFNALINTAQGVSAALATGPAGIPLAAIIGALGAAQVAAIAATPLPALQSGALVSGRNTVVVGEYAGADNNPELISPVNKVQKYITEAVQNSGGGGAQQLYSFISGDDIMLVSERGAYRKSRVG